MTHIYDRPPMVDEPPAWDDPGPEPTPPPPATGHTAPNDAAAERVVIGSSLRDPAVLAECASIVTAADFWQTHHELIWRTLLHLRATDQPTSPEAVVAHLIDTQQIRLLGRPDYLFDLYQAADVPAQAPYFAKRIDQLARRRRGIDEVRKALRRLEAPGPDTDLDQTLTETAHVLLDAHQALGNPPAVTTWSPVDLAPVLAGEHLDPPPTMLMRSDGIYLFYDGAVHTVSGESESGKTWLCLMAALQLIQAGEHVTFVDFEDRADRVVGRLLALGATLDQIRKYFAYIRPDRPLDDDGRAQLAPAVTAARLVILDGVTEAMTTHGFDLNSNADSALFQALLPRWIADHGPAVVMIDHVVKDKEKQDRFALGAQHKLAGIDGVAYIVKMLQPFARGHRGLARVEIAKDRPGHVREHAHGRSIAEFTLDATAGDLVLLAHLQPPGAESGRTGDTFEPTYLMEKISRYVQANPGMSKKAIEGAMNGKATTIRLALELLVTRHYVGVKAGSRGAVQHFHVKPYCQDGDPDEDTTDDAETTPEQEAS